MPKICSMLKAQLLSAFIFVGIGVAYANAQSMLSYELMPEEAKEKANDIVETCKEMDLSINELNYSFIQLNESNKKNKLVLFQPSNICGRNKGGACSTDGCEIFVYYDKGGGDWRKVLDISEGGLQWLEEQKGKPAQLIATVRGGTPWCSKERSSQCTILYTWNGAGFDSKRLR